MRYSWVIVVACAYSSSANAGSEHELKANDRCQGNLPLYHKAVTQYTKLKRAREARVLEISNTADRDNSSSSGRHDGVYTWDAW